MTPLKPLTSIYERETEIKLLY